MPLGTLKILIPYVVIFLFIKYVYNTIKLLGDYVLLKKFRIASFVEGLSYLTLLFIAMPIKYIGDNPIPVKIVGMTHGLLFFLFIYFLYMAASEYKWSKKFTIVAFISSLIPFGMLFLDKKLKKLDSASVELV
jgi:integral membrane protein